MECEEIVINVITTDQEQMLLWQELSVYANDINYGMDRDDFIRNGSSEFILIKKIDYEPEG